MDTSRSRRILVVDQTDGQSSDSDEVRVIEGNQPAKNKRVKKTMKKVKDKEEEELERTLRESGIDLTGMTKEEKLNIAQVIMMSKQEADELNKMEMDVTLHTDSEEEKQTTEAFQQAVHPSSQTVDLSEPEVQNVSLLNKAQSPGQNKDHLTARYQQHFEEQPNTSVGSPPSNSPADQTLQQSIYDSSQTAEAFEEAVHPRSTPEEEVMEEDPIPVTRENKKVTTNVKPIHQKQQKRQNRSNQDIKNQTRIDDFTQIVIPEEKRNNQVKEKLDALISEDDSSPERKKRMTDSVVTADVENSTSHDQCDTVKSANVSKKLFEPNLKEFSSEDEQQDKNKKKMNSKSGPGNNVENMISDDEGNPTPSTSGAKKMFQPSWKDLISDEDSSPIKRPTTGAKKAFVWSEESDEETQDLFIDKKSVKGMDEEQNIIGKKKQNQNFGSQEEVTDFAMEEPFSEKFYEFPQLHRHYRSVRKQKKEQLSTLFAPPETDPQAYTKALVQLFSLYHIRLTQLQKSSRHFLSWPKDPVKVGRHLDTTIDAKKRGLDYDFLEIDNEIQFAVNSKSIVPAGVSNDASSKQPSVKPLTKNFNFKTRKDRNVTRETPTPLEEIDDFVESSKQLRSGRSRNVTKESVIVEEEDLDDYLDSFVSMTTRKSRTRNTANFTKQKSAEDFEPFPVNESFKYSAEQGKKRKLYNEHSSQYCPIIEDNNSNDFDMGNKTTGRSGKIVKLKGEETSNNRSGRSETQRKRSRGNINNGSQAATATRGSLKRMPSDLSVESAKSEELNNFLDPVRPPSRSSDASLDGLSQSSDVLLDPQGQLYPTQFCAMQEKRVKTPTTKSDPTDAENENLFRQYMSQQNENERNKQESNLHFSTNNATQSFENLSKASHDTWSNVSSILPQNVIEKTCNPGDEKTEKDQQSTSLKSRLFKTVNNFIKLGPTKKTPERKPEQVNTEFKLISEDHGVHATRVVESEHLLDTQGFQLTSDTMEDDIQQIYVNREVKTYCRQQGRKRQLTENDENEQNKVPKVTVPCPLCNKQFPQDKIETHAADCNGPDDDENTSNEVQVVPGVGNIEPSSSGIQRPNRSRVNKKQDEDVDFVIEDDDSDKENPTKSNLACYVCDKVCRNQNLYDQHVEKCLQEATQRQHQIETRGMENADEEEQTTPKRTTRSAKASLNSPEGYSSGSENEKVTLRDIVNDHSSSSSEESSYSDEYDWSPSKTPPDYKPTNKENVLPGGWTLEELTNSPIRSYVPISKQSDSEGFKSQFDKAKQRYERQLLKGKGKRKQKGNKRKRKRKRSSKNKCAAKKTRLE